MPPELAGPELLSAKIAVRLTAPEKERLRLDADLAGLTVSALVRRRYFGRPVVASADLAVIKELRRLGGLLKYVHAESGGAYSRQTAAALDELRAAIIALAKRADGAAP